MTIPDLPTDRLSDEQEKELERLRDEHCPGLSRSEFANPRVLAFAREVYRLAQREQRKRDAKKLERMIHDVDSQHWRVALERGTAAIRAAEEGGQAMSGTGESNRGREQFEEWRKLPNENKPLDMTETTDGWAWEAWQAAYARGVADENEACAKLAEQVTDDWEMEQLSGLIRSRQQEKTKEKL